MTAPLVILLHGVGSRGADLRPLEDHMRGLIPDARFAAPDGPDAFDRVGSGRQWFSLTGISDANRPARIAAARDAFDRTIAPIAAAHGLSDRLDRVALVGFSQGAIMTLDAIVSGRWPVAAAVAFAGRLASPPPFAPATGTPVLLSHGTADPVMPIALCREAETELRALGFAVDRHETAGLGHRIGAEGADLAGRFLAGKLAAQA